MEAEERPSKMRKLGHGFADARVSTVQHIHDSKPDFSEVSEEKTSRKGEQHENQNDIDTAESSDGEVSSQVEKAIRPPSISKNAWKKIQKKAEWEAGRDYRKVKRKQKIQEKKVRDRQAKSESRSHDTAQSIANQTAATKSRTRKYIRLPVTFLIDCQFDDLMIEKERISLGSQLTRSYSDNIRAPFQAHLVISSWGGLLKERFDTVLAKHHENWRGVVFTEKDFVESVPMAKDAMQGKNGGEMAGIFRKYASEQLPENGSVPVNPRIGLPPHTSENVFGQTYSITDDTKSLQPDNVEGSNHSYDPLLAKPQTSEHVKAHGMQEQPFSKSVPETAIGLGTPELADQNGSAPLSSTKSLPINGEAAVCGPNDALPSTEMYALEGGEIVYLTSDSPYTLDELKPYSTYIIGGLVDKNRHKGICYKTACERGIKTAKLPIGDFMEMQSRFVLATNHVVEIMVRWLECGDWGKAFLDVIPKRKGGKLRDSDGLEESS